ncbi:UvrD-helicase domain-containing protein [Luteimonas fraxinea]|uniref:UvrD-helicase domain-containing protein n=1 Tax=Luteimonas fraxinea TaxID=2901869 RepID=UPI001E4B8914|nr:UvrD-helicase domain-containing protein [Luteimonas fraxinea]MCD9126049.1 UvrD-helicase domain-containing protein [Luteimonas fraxinea]
MKQTWAPSALGRTFTGSSQWRIDLDGLTLSLSVFGQVHRVSVEDESSYIVRVGALWTDVEIHSAGAERAKGDGLPNRHGRQLLAAIAAALEAKRTREAVVELRETLNDLIHWFDRVDEVVAKADADHRWLTHESQCGLEDAQPRLRPREVTERMKPAAVRKELGEEVVKLEAALARWDDNHRATWAVRNRRFAEREKGACKPLLDGVEKMPLTDEQASAVVCFDNRVQVVASAGSGKTSTMVAKAAYAIHRGIAKPERIVMMAFNKSAAEELKERAAKSFERLGMQGVTVEATTFHAMGLRIIGKATGEKPDIPEWAIDTGSGLSKLEDLVDLLKDRSPAFRTQWDLFLFVFGKDLPAVGAAGVADAWDDDGTVRLRTAHGELVRSQEEAMIANWLFLNGVNYSYEEPYRHKTADEAHRQYRPDFFYPELDLYHEHFALDAQGNAPARFGDYLGGVTWKRALHLEKGTQLFETTSHGLRNGDDFQRLEDVLTARGVVLDPNPARPIPADGQKPMEAAELISLLRTFISHAKSNCLTVSALGERLDAMPDGTFKHRHRMFLGLAAPLLEAWDAALKAEGSIDFEDMLNLAAKHLEQGRCESPFDLVMADEFQDASRARARLCRALVQRAERFFFAVGDDWQSINRFAGADVSVMTRFREWFGHGQVLKLEQTFRCPQALCDVSSLFVSKNPAQFKKQVRSVTPQVGPVLQAFQAQQKDYLGSAIQTYLERLCQGLQDGSIPPGRNGKVSVFVLGRYNADRQYVPTRRHHLDPWMDLSFLTIHRSKGSEADYVILPEMVSVRRGRSFPNTRADDPVLALAMPDGDDFPMGEERRLFYVALTRARRGVALFTARGQRSSFLKELVDEGVLSVTDMEGKAIHEQDCPRCGTGVIIWKKGPYSDFRACSGFPACRYKSYKTKKTK